MYDRELTKTCAMGQCFSWCLPQPEPQLEHHPEPKHTLRRSAKYQRLTKSVYVKQSSQHTRRTAQLCRSYAAKSGGYVNGSSSLVRPFFDTQSGSPHLEKVSIEGGKPTGERWYHGDIIHDKAKYRLNEGDKEGTFLVYDNPNKTGEYLLRVLVVNKHGKYRGQREHRCWRILCIQGSKWVVGEPPFVTNHASVQDLIEHHKKKPLLLENGGKVKLGTYVYMPPED